MKQILLMIAVVALVGCSKICPECKESVKAKARKCIHCEYNIAAHEAAIVAAKARAVREAERAEAEKVMRKARAKLRAKLLRWEFKTGGDVFSSPAIGSDGTVYVGERGRGGKLYAINGKSGVKLWEFETGDRVESSPAIGSDGTVYVGSEDNKLYAINGKSGSKLWEFETGRWLWSPPAIGSDGTVYVGSY